MQRAMLLQETAGCPATAKEELRKVKHVLYILKKHLFRHNSADIQIPTGQEKNP